MQMPYIGSMYQYTKNMKLQMKWQQRKANPNMEKGLDEDPQAASLRRQAESVRKGNMTAALDGKLKAGMKLTAEEMEYLRQNNPDLYQKAHQIEQERKQYKKSLSNCKTKEDVEKLNMQKMQNYVMETNTIKNNPNIPQGKKQELLEQITRRTMGVKAEHTVYVQSPEYAKLPENQEEYERRKMKKREQLQGSGEEQDNIREKQDIDDFLDEELRKLEGDFSTPEEAAPFVEEPTGDAEVNFPAVSSQSAPQGGSDAAKQ